MSILLDKKTRVLVQGITGRDGSFHTKMMMEYGTKVIAGVTPGKGGQKMNGVPVFDTVSDAMEMKPDAACIFVPPAFAVDALWESVEAGIKLITVITEGIPTLEMMKVKNHIKGRGITIIGPNCPGIITPGEAKIGILPGSIFKKGNVGVISRSGTLTYEVVYALTEKGIGQSTVIGIGGDPIIGSRFLDLLEKFKNDKKTDSVVIIGEIGGNDEIEAAQFIKEELKKPACAFIAGKSAPAGKKMGHAGAIISGSSDTAQAKIEALLGMGIPVAALPQDVAGLLK